MDLAGGGRVRVGCCASSMPRVAMLKRVRNLGFRVKSHAHEPDRRHCVLEL